MEGLLCYKQRYKAYSCVDTEESSDINASGMVIRYNDSNQGVEKISTPVRWQIKVKNWVYMVVIPLALVIAQQTFIDIPHLKLFTKNILTCIPTHHFDKKHDRSKH